MDLLGQEASASIQHLAHEFKSMAADLMHRKPLTMEQKFVT